MPAPKIQTKQRFSYGTYEARMKTDTGSGLNAAFFTYIGPADKQPHDEIDFEVLTKDTSKVQVNAYISGKGNNEKLADVKGGADGGFNDYAFVWKPDGLSWYVNGELVNTITDPAKLPSHSQKIFFSLWGSDTLGDGWAPLPIPAVGDAAGRPRCLHGARRRLPVPGIRGLQTSVIALRR